MQQPRGALFVFWTPPDHALLEAIHGDEIRAPVGLVAALDARQGHEVAAETPREPLGAHGLVTSAQARHQRAHAGGALPQQPLRTLLIRRDAHSLDEAPGDARLRMVE